MAKRRSSRSRGSSAREPIDLQRLTAKSLNIIPGYDAIDTAEGCVFDADAALHAIGFLQELCRFTKGVWAGKPFLLQDWQLAFVGNLFGWKRKDGTRRYRDGRLWVPRKGGKSEMVAGVSLLGLHGDGEPTPEVAGIAADRKQAKIILDRAKAMVRAEPELMTRSLIYQTRIVAPDVAGVYAAHSSDAPSAHGLHTSMMIADEIHAMGNNRGLWEAIQTSMGARRQPLVIGITTAGTLRESLEWDEYDYSCKVRDRRIQNFAFLPAIYEAPESMDWRTPQAWYAANPSLGVTIPEAVYAAECKRAVDQPSYETPFRTLFLNQHVTADTRWLPMAAWDACKTEFDPAKLRGLPCFLGIDLGEVEDLTSLTAVWLDGDECYLKTWSYAPQEGAQKRAARARVPYLEWAQRGFLTLTPGNATDYGFMRAEIGRLVSEHRVLAVGYDPHNAGGISANLESDGLKLKRVPQSFLGMSGPTRRWEAMVMGRKLHHDGNPLLAWAMSNCVVELDMAQNPRPSKRRSVEKIDPVVAGIIALAVALDGSDAVENPYADRGIQWV